VKSVFSGLCNLRVFAPDYLCQGLYRRLSTAFQKSPCLMLRPFFMRRSAAFSGATNRGVWARINFSSYSSLSAATSTAFGRPRVKRGQVY